MQELSKRRMKIHKFGVFSREVERTVSFTSLNVDPSGYERQA